MNKEEKWHVIYTRSRHEKILAEQLTEAGFTVYLPLILKETKWSDRKKTVEEPLFKSYVFIKEVSDKALFKDYKSFVTFVNYNGKPAVVWQREINTLRSIIKHGYDVTELMSLEEIEKGSKVLIMGGPLKGMTGELISVEDKDCFVIHFENIGNSLLVKLPSKILKKI